jgi:hypothetical protein
MKECPRGSYCPDGAQIPTPCPRGTYGPLTMSTSLFGCPVCPAGSLCNTTGVVDPTDFLCPPGYYCGRGSTDPIKCPSGSYRAVPGGSSSSSCFICDAGYFCPQEATIVPSICPNGTYCPAASNQSTPCPPGYYCPANSASPILCPRGFYCPGRSELMYKCANGTYCP